MGLKLSAALAALMILTTVRLFQAGDYVFGAAGIFVVATAAHRTYKMWGQEPG